MNLTDINSRIYTCFDQDALGHLSQNGYAPLDHNSRTRSYAHPGNFPADPLPDTLRPLLTRQP